MGGERGEEISNKQSKTREKAHTHIYPSYLTGIREGDKAAERRRGNNNARSLREPVQKLSSLLLVLLLSIPFLTLGLLLASTYSRAGSSLLQLFGRQQSERRAQREQGKPPSPVSKGVGVGHTMVYGS